MQRAVRPHRRTPRRTGHFLSRTVVRIVARSGARSVCGRSLAPARSRRGVSSGRRAAPAGRSGGNTARRLASRVVAEGSLTVRSQSESPIHEQQLIRHPSVPAGRRRHHRRRIQPARARGVGLSRRRASAVLAEDSPGEHAPPRGRPCREGGRHRGGWRAGRPGSARRSRSCRPVSCCRTSPACLRWSTSPRCARASRAWAATPDSSTRCSRPSWSSTTRCRSITSGPRTRWSSTRSSSSRATVNGTPSSSGVRTRFATSRWCRPTPASSTRSTSSTWRGWCAATRRTGASWPIRTPWSAPTRTRRWSTASASSAGASAASRPRPRCSGSRSRCSSRT